MIDVQLLHDGTVHMRVTGDHWQEVQPGKLTTEDLHCVIEAKRVIELWKAGEISELPIDPPRPA